MFRRLVLAASSLTVTAIALALVAGAGFSRPASALTNCSANSGGWNSAENELLGLINEFRQQNGRAPLTASPALANMAAWMAEDMAAHGGVANPPTHDDWSGRTFSQRASQCGATGYSGENVGWGFPSAQSMFNGWYNSSGHRAAMLNASFKYVGLGQVGSFWAADFSSNPGSGGGTEPPTSTPTVRPTQPPANTPPPTQPGGGATSTPTDNGAPTASPSSTPSAGGATPIPGYKLPSSFPIRRAMVPLIATE